MVKKNQLKLRTDADTKYGSVGGWKLTRVDIHAEKAVPTFLRFLGIIFFVSVSANFENYIRPHTDIACDRMEGIT